VIFETDSTDWKDSLKIGSTGAFPKIRKIDAYALNLFYLNLFLATPATTGRQQVQLAFLPAARSSHIYKAKDSRAGSFYLLGNKY